MVNVENNLVLNKESEIGWKGRLRSTFKGSVGTAKKSVGFVVLDYPLIHFISILDILNDMLDETQFIYCKVISGIL